MGATVRGGTGRSNCDRGGTCAQFGDRRRIEAPARQWRRRTAFPAQSISGRRFALSCLQAASRARRGRDNAPKRRKGSMSKVGRAHKRSVNASAAARPKVVAADRRHEASTRRPRRSTLTKQLCLRPAFDMEHLQPSAVQGRRDEPGRFGRLQCYRARPAPKLALLLLRRQPWKRNGAAVARRAKSRSSRCK